MAVLNDGCFVCRVRCMITMRLTANTHTHACLTDGDGRLKFWTYSGRIIRAGIGCQAPGPAREPASCIMHQLRISELR